MNDRIPHIIKAAQIIQKGGIIAYPTEAVMGLGCDPFNYETVSRLLSLKKRQINKGLILISHDWECLLPYIDTLHWSAIRQTIQTQTSVPTTWIVPANNSAPKWITGQFHSIAVRIPQHEIALALCQAVNHPIVSTSANISNQAPTKDILSTRLRFKTAVDYYLPGKVGGWDKPSKIIDAITGKVVRG